MRYQSRVLSLTHMQLHESKASKRRSRRVGLDMHCDFATWRARDGSAACGALQRSRRRAATAERGESLGARLHLAWYDAAAASTLAILAGNGLHGAKLGVRASNRGAGGVHGRQGAGSAGREERAAEAGQLRTAGR